jgi:hypothetical protein
MQKFQQLNEDHASRIVAKQCKQSFDTHLQQNDYVASSSALVNLAANNDQFVFGDVAGFT